MPSAPALVRVLVTSSRSEFSGLRCRQHVQRHLQTAEPGCLSGAAVDDGVRSRTGIASSSSTRPEGCCNPESPPSDYRPETLHPQSSSGLPVHRQADEWSAHHTHAAHTPLVFGEPDQTFQLHHSRLHIRLSSCPLPLHGQQRRISCAVPLGCTGTEAACSGPPYCCKTAVTAAEISKMAAAVPASRNLKYAFAPALRRPMHVRNDIRVRCPLWSYPPFPVGVT